MGKFYGKVGYVETVQAARGVYEGKVIEERYYYGDVLENAHRWQASEHLNDDSTISCRISILADSYAYENFSKIKYAEWMGIFWKVTSVEPSRPRLTLTLGGEYNGKTLSGPSAPSPG